MNCQQCSNERRSREMTSVGIVDGKDVWYCECCGTLVSPEFSDPIVPTLVRRVSMLLEDNESNAQRQRRDIHDIMGKIT